MLTTAHKMRTFLSRALRGESGGALVETAITAPLLMLLVVGAAEFSRVAYASLEVTSAAKAGVSYGAQQGGMAGDTTGITYAATNDAADVTSLKVTSVSSQYACSDGSTFNAGCSTGHIEQTLTVNTQATIDPLIHVPGLPTTYTIDASASQLCQQ
jgi:Flp pilus assembly protein TadG